MNDEIASEMANRYGDRHMRPIGGRVFAAFEAERVGPRR